MSTQLFWATSIHLLLAMPCLLAQESSLTSTVRSADSLSLPIYAPCYQPELEAQACLQCTRDILALQIFSNIQWPEQALANRGFITVKVVIDTSGKMAECKLVEGLHPLLDESVMQAMSKMSDFVWRPLWLNGKPNSAAFSLSIKYNPDEYGDNQVVFNKQPIEVKKEELWRDVRVVENVPVFPDGPAAMWRFIAQNLELPEWWPDSTIEGMVVLQFRVEKDGSLHDIQVVKGLQSEIDASCVKMVQKMPKWQLGRSRGALSPCIYTLRIRIKLE